MIDEHHVFVTFTASISERKRLQNTSLGHVEKLQENVPESKPFTSVLLRQENNR